MRIGVDLGGSKIAAVVLDEEGETEAAVAAELRVSTPQGDYRGTLEAIGKLVQALEAEAGRTGLPVGIGTPGTLDPDTGTLRGSNSTCLNGQPIRDDLSRLLQRPIVMANDANCLVLSEAYDGEAADAEVVFGVILGTGVGGGLVVNRRLLTGRHGIGGEWGHTPLAGKSRELRCWCGQWDCIEAHLCGPALQRRSGYADARQLAADVQAGRPSACESYEFWLQDLGRALAQVINVVDPDTVVFGGGLSQMPDLCQRLAPKVAEYLFAPSLKTRLRVARHGDASGVRGAARLTRNGTPSHA